MTTKVLEIALAIIRHPTEERYLIALRRHDAHLPDLWEFPGGKRLSGERLEDCAVREAREETGLTVTVAEAWPPIPHQYPDRSVVLHPFLCRADNADARPLANRRVVWAAPGELDRYLFPAANAPLLARLRA